MKKRYRKKSWIDPRIETRSSPLHGKGMFAVAPIKQGEVAVIWELAKTYKNREDAEKAAANGRAKGKSIFVGQIDDNLYTVEERGDDPTYFMNHSCDPNVWLKDEVTLIARRDIKPKEELTIDYALAEADEDLRHHGSVFVALHCAERDIQVKIGEFLNCKKGTMVISHHLSTDELQN